MSLSLYHALHASSRRQAFLYNAVAAQVSSCFSQLLNLHNLSEEISNAQLERAVRIGEVILPPKQHAEP